MHNIFGSNPYLNCTTALLDPLKFAFYTTPKEAGAFVTSCLKYSVLLIFFHIVYSKEWVRNEFTTTL